MNTNNIFLVKKFKNNYKIKLNALENNKLSFIIFNKNNKLLLNYKFNWGNNYIMENKIISLTTFNWNKYITLIYNSLYYKLNILNNFFYMNYSKINVIGLGYKNFVFKNNLYMLLGDANYLLIPILDNIKIICKKNQIYILSLDKQLVSNFSKKIMLLKKINPYKGKGLIQFKNFKFMKLKTGKKQRFM